jgi:hypothetical protein
MSKQLVIIPNFHGFYDSAHSQIIEGALESLCYDRETDEANQELAENIWEYANYPAIHNAYAKEYVENFCAGYDVNLVFNSLSSPKEYNFTNDRIYCHISQREVRRLFKIVKTYGLDIFNRVCSDTFKSRDGFISFYNHNWKEWGNVLTWDANQLSALLEAYIECEYERGVSAYSEWDIMERSICNGVIEGIIIDTSPRVLDFIYGQLAEA